MVPRDAQGTQGSTWGTQLPYQIPPKSLYGALDAYEALRALTIAGDPDAREDWLLVWHPMSPMGALRARFPLWGDNHPAGEV